MNRQKILIVEDEFLIASGIKKNLENSGYTITSIVGTGENALAAAEKDRPDLVLMDIVLDGEMDGIETAGRIREQYGIPIIFLTAYSENTVVRSALQTEPFAFITKPFDIHQLIIHIEMTLYKSKLEKEKENLIHELQNEINERKEAENLILASEKNYRDIYDKTPVSIWVHDCRETFRLLDTIRDVPPGDLDVYFDSNPGLLDALVSSNKLIDVNNETLRIYGARTKDDIFREFGKHRLPELKTVFRRLAASYLSGETLFRLETVNQTLDGRRIDIFVQIAFTEESKKTGRVLFSVIDITDFKRAEKALSESEERYRHLFEQAPVGIGTASFDGKILAANRTMELITGYSAEELKGINLADTYVNPKQREELLEILKLSRSVDDYHVLLKRKDGTEYDASLTIGIVNIAGMDVLQTILQDITERKRIEEVLKESEKKFRTAVENNPDILVFIKRDGTIFDVNRLEKGFTREIVVGHSVFDGKWYESKDQLKSVRKAISDSIKTGTTSIYEYSQIAPDGSLSFYETRVSPFEYDTRGEIISLQLATRDITERKRAEEALRESEAKYRGLFENSVMGISQALPDGRLINANEAYVRMYGYENQEEMMADVFDVGHQLYANPEDRKEVLRILKEKGVMEPREIAVVKRDGTRFFVLAGAREVRDSQGTLQCYQAEHIDITERKKAEESLRAASLYSRSLIEASLDPLVTINAEGRITDVNTATEKITGISRERLIGSDFVDYFTKPEMARAGYLKVFEQGQVIDYPLAVRHTSGAITDVLYNASVYRNEQGEVLGAFAAARDITERKRVEKELKKTETYLRTVLSNAPITIFAIDNKGMFTLSEGKGLERVGLAPGENVGVSALDLYTSKLFVERNGKVTTGKDIIRRVFAGETVNAVDDLRGVYFDNYIGPMRDTEGKVVGIVGVATDITERKRTEEALINSEEMYRLLFENMMNGFAYCRMIYYRSKPQDFTYLNVNEAFEEQTGLKNVVGKKVTEVIPGIRESNPELFEIYGRVALSGKPEKFEIFLKSLKMWLLISVYSLKKDYFVSVFDVITERKLAEETLRESEERFRAAFEFANTGMVLIDLDGRIMKVNNKMCEIAGYSGEELESMTVNDITYPEDNTISPMFFKSAISGECENRVFEKRYVHKQGHVIVGRVSGALIRDFQGNPLHFVSQVEDITESKRAEMQLREDKRKLRSLALELTLSEDHERRKIAEYLHDMISQALVVIRMKLGTLQELKDPEPAAILNKEICELLEKAIESTRSITFDLSSPVLDKLGFEPAVEWLCEKMAEDHGLAIDFRSDSSKKDLDDNSKRFLYRSTRELLMNVVKHACAHHVKVSVRRKKEMLCITVDDDGDGFREGLEDNRYMERGYGLFSIRERLDHLGGRMEIDSKPGCGTCVSLYAPLGKKKAQKKQEQP